MAACDLSDGSRHVIGRAGRIASATGARCTVMHAVGHDVADTVRALLGQGTADVTPDVLDGIRKEIESIAGQEGHPGADPAVVVPAVVVETGPPAPTISEYADLHDVDLVVLGSLDAGGVRRMIFGSTSYRLMRRSTCPVLVVKQPASRDYDRILVAVDFSPASAESIRLAKVLAPEADMTLIHVSSFPLQAQMRYAGVSDERIVEYGAQARAQASWSLEDVTQAAGLGPDDYTSVVVEGEPGEQITGYCDEHDCDLVVVGKHGTHRVEELLLGSVTHSVISSTASDVLVVVDP